MAHTSSSWSPWQTAATGKSPRELSANAQSTDPLSTGPVFFRPRHASRKEAYHGGVVFMQDDRVSATIRAVRSHLTACQWPETHYAKAQEAET